MSHTSETVAVVDELDDVIHQNAQGPAEVSSDAGTVKQHGLRDQIEADKYLSAKHAAGLKNRGLRFNKLVPPGVG